MKSPIRILLAAAVALHCAGLAAMPLGLRTAMWGAGVASLPKTYTLTLNPNGGEYKNKTTAHKIPNSSQTTKPTYGKSYYWRVGAATRTGYTFKGWYDAKSGGKQVYDANGDAVNGDYWKGSGKTATWSHYGNVTLYAQWAKEYAITFYPNGSGSTLSGKIFGDADGQSKTAKVKVATGLADNNTVGVAKRPGYTFMGWYTQRDAGGIVFDADGNCRKGGAFWNSKGCWIKNANVSLYAHWEPITRNLRFYPNGGDTAKLSGAVFGEADGKNKTAVLTVTYGSSANSVVGKARRAGYYFQGWFTDRTAGTRIYDSNGKAIAGNYWKASGSEKTWQAKSSAELKLYAQWRKAPSSAPPVIVSSALAVPVPSVALSEIVDGVAYLPDGESFPVEVRVDADGFAVVELEDAVFCGYVADGVGELFSGDRTLYLILSP